jgi:hypothetical protein
VANRASDLTAQATSAFLDERERCTWVAHSWTLPGRLYARFPGLVDHELRMLQSLASAIAEDLASGRSSSPQEATL